MTKQIYKYDITEYRRVLGFQKSPKFLAWAKAEYNGYDLHHILGSVHGKKFTDYLIHPVPHTFHLAVVEPKKAQYFDFYLPGAVRDVIRYAKVMFDWPDCFTVADLKPETIKKLIERVYAAENAQQVPIATRIVEIGAPKPTKPKNKSRR